MSFSSPGPEEEEDLYFLYLIKMLEQILTRHPRYFYHSVLIITRGFKGPLYLGGKSPPSLFFLPSISGVTSTSELTSMTSSLATASKDIATKVSILGWTR